MNPVVAGSLIGAGGNLLGGLLGSREASKNRAAQKEFAQFGIRWRVADAKAAGLHPLYALGAQVPSFSPVHSEAPAQLAEMGQNIGRAVQAQMTAREKVRAALELQLLQSQIGETDARADLARSQAARNAQEYGQSTGLGTDTPFDQSLAPEGVHVLGQHVNKAPVSHMGSELDDSVGSNVNPMWSRFNIGKNIEIVLPGGMGGDAAESLESLSESPMLLWMTFMENKHRYGQSRADWLMQRYVGDAWEEMKDKINSTFNPFEAFRSNFKQR